MSQNIFKNPFVSQVPYLSGSSIGNGTLTIDRLTHFTVDQKYTAICSATAPFTVFNIIGEKDGIVGVAVVGEQFTDEDNKIFLTIQQGPVLFQIGDMFEFVVSQGTDLNQQNLDAYDELPQKNFGQGLTGQNKGDNNIRFKSELESASEVIGTLKFTAKESGPKGNGVSLQYEKGTLLTQAELTLQGLKFTANQGGTQGNDISVEFVQGDPGQFATATIQDMDYEADLRGFDGNNISIEYIGGGTRGAEVVTVVDKAITVQIQDGVSTVEDIQIALALNSSSSPLVNTTARLTGSEPQKIHPKTFLTGGTDPSADAVQVQGKAIKITFQNGINTLQEVHDIVMLDTDALTLITPSITGVPQNVMTSPVAPTFLSGGLDNYGEPGNEIVSINGTEIHVIHVNSSAQQLKTKLETVPAIVELLTISLLGNGTEVQPSPVPKSYLAGGLEAGSYAFNKSEITDPADFFEGNAPVIFNGETNQGDELTLGETMKKGKVTLADDVALNKSGPAVLNTQQTINNLIQNGKCFLISDKNEKVFWKAPTLEFIADILFVFPDTGMINRISFAQSPVTILDGESLWVEVDRFNHITMVIQKGKIVPTGENIFRLVTRIGEFLVWWENTIQKDGKKISIGMGGGGGGTGFQEKLGTGDGISKVFPLTFVPSNETSMLVICSYIRGIEEYYYEPVGNALTFRDEFTPAPGQDIYVFYLTDGETIEVPTPDGVLNSYVHTITQAEQDAREFTLKNIPAFPSRTLVDVIGGGSAEFNFHFTISVNKFQWAGYGLDGLLTKGDKVRLHFYS